MGSVGWGWAQCGAVVCADDAATAAWASASQWVPRVLAAGCDIQENTSGSGPIHRSAFMHVLKAAAFKAVCMGSV